jgi:hypothetical protein
MSVYICAVHAYKHLSPFSSIRDSGPSGTCKCVSYQEVIMDLECIVNQIFPPCLKILFHFKNHQGFLAHFV